MRPLQLELENIGPFVERTIVDFGHFGPSSLFLICGRTGSGKSFLFDSICYALYGQTPSAREGSLRSDHSRETDRPTIRFSFSLGGDAYEVVRTLPYKEVKQRGTGFKEVGETQCLRRLAPVSEVLATKKTEVNKDCKELVQLELDQFSRVMMIPQGEFRELLRADTERREKLLRKLFRSELYLDLTNGIDGRFKESNGRYLDMRKETGTLLSQFAEKLHPDERGPSDEVKMEQILKCKEERIRSLSPLRDEVRKLTEEYERSRNFTKWMEQALELKKKKEDLVVDIQRLETKDKDEVSPFRTSLAKHELATELLHHHKAIIDKEKKVENLTKDIGNNDIELKVCQRELKLVESEKDKLPVLRARFESILSNQGRTDSLLNDINRSKEIKEDLSAKEKVEKGLEKDLISSVSKERGISEQLGQLEKELLKLGEPVTDLGTTSAELDVVRDLTEVLRRKAKLEPRLVSLKKQHASQIEQTKVLKERLDELKRFREGSLAFELAVGLRPRECCPVCGSTDHPVPASPPEKVVRKEEVEASEIELKASNDESNKLKALVVKDQTEIEGYTQRVIEMTGRYPELAGSDVLALEKLEKKLVRSIQEERKRQTDLEGLRKHQTCLIGQRTVLTDERSNKQMSLERLRAEIVSVRKKLLEASSKIEEDLKALSSLLPTEEDPVRLVKTLSAEKESIPGKIDLVEKMFNEATESLIKLSSRIDKTVKDMEETRKDLKKLEDELYMRLSDPRYSIFKGREDIVSSIMGNDDHGRIKGLISSFEKELSKLRGRLEQTEKDLKAHLGDAVVPSEERLLVQRDDESKKQTSQEEARGKLSDLEHEVRELERALKRVEDITRAMTEMEPDLAILKDLSEQVKGLGRPRLSLERFFLAHRFEEVLIAANTRLSKLSEGRFLLRREEEGTTGGQSRAGLDIVVFDNLTGTERPANSMSGGQMFLASLALALGLADVVQARSGGIRMDALFIDEGFGSLDEETLQLALKVLTELRSGRMVGVISHVQELRRQIPQRIEVVPATVGSRIKIVT